MSSNSVHTNSLITVNLSSLVQFCDENKMDSPHASAIKGFAFEELLLALLMHYLRNNQQEPNAPPELLAEKCTGHDKWLDGWLRAGNIHYQVEVKSWSFHGYGSKKDNLAHNANNEQYRAYAMRLWTKYWDTNKLRFHDPKLDKVRLPMKQFTDPIYCCMPLACVWQVIHPKGEIEPFFEVEDCDGKFVKIFSASAYTRFLLSKEVNELPLNLPATRARREILHRIFR